MNLEDLEDEDTVYGINAPARNVSELTVASLTLINNLKENQEGTEKSFHLTHYLDTYVKENPLTPINFQNIDLEWFNVAEPLSFEEHLDSHVVVLDFFTYCCINCLHILPDLEALEEKYKPNHSPVVVVGIHSAKFDNERTTKRVSDAIKRNNISHPVANDVKCKLWYEHGISCWPTLLIVGPGGLPLFVLMGEGNKDLLFQFIEESLHYFTDIGSLNPKPLPLSPQLYLPSKESDIYYPGKVGTFNKGLIISDSGNNRIILTTWDGEVKEVIGSGKKGFTDGSFESASFTNPQGVVYHSSGVIFVADTDNHAIRKINLETRTVETVAGNGTQGHDQEGGGIWKDQMISSPWDLCLGHSLDASTDAPPNVLFIAMAGLHQIWGIFLTDGLWLKKCYFPEGTVVRLAGTGIEENRNTSYPLKAGFAQPSGISMYRSPEGQILFIADSESSSIRLFSLIDGWVKKVAGGSVNPTDLFAYGDEDGAPNVARFQHPMGIAVSEGKIYVADTYNHKIKMLTKDKKNYITETLFGNENLSEDTNNELYQLSEPSGLCVSLDGRFLYVADTNNFSIKEYNIEKGILRQINLRFPNEFLDASEDVMDSKNCLTIYLPPNTRVKINLKLKLNIPIHVHLTPDVKQKYALSYIGDVFVSSQEGTLNYETTVPLEVDLSANPTAQLDISSTLFLCFDDSRCTMERVLTEIKFLRNDKENFEELNVDAEIKTNL